MNLKDNISKGRFGNVRSSIGIILLHPFLFPLFSSLDLMNDKQFREEATKLKAFAVLRYIVFQKEEVSECSVHFLKFLCGLDPSLFIPKLEEVTINDIEEIEACLQAFIAHWSVLKQTSVASLRRSFLQREGIWKCDAEQVNIYCETSPFDILLDYYPWNLGIVKIPWLQPLFYVSFT